MADTLGRAPPAIFTRAWAIRSRTECRAAAVIGERERGADERAGNSGAQQRGTTQSGEQANTREANKHAGVKWAQEMKWQEDHTS